MEEKIEYVDNLYGEVEYSWFVFNDVIGNGELTFESRPIAGVQVEVTTPSGEVFYVSSNNGGFVNFPVGIPSLDNNTNYIIKEAGTYVFKLIVPTDWITTSDFQEQYIDFVHNPEKRGVFIPNKNLVPVGIKPQLTVRGCIKEHLEDGTIVESQPNRCDVTITNLVTEEVHIVALDDHGKFRTILDPGDYRINIKGRDYWETDYSFSVGRYPVVLFPFYLNDDRGYNEPSFDNEVKLSPDNTTNVFKVPPVYSGMKWDGFVMARQSTYEGPGYANNFSLDNWVVYNGSGFPAYLRKFDDNTLSLSHIGVICSNTRLGELETMWIEVTNKDGLKYLDDYPISCLTPSEVHLNYKDAEEIKFHTEEGWHILIGSMFKGLN